MKKNQNVFLKVYSFVYFIIGLFGTFAIISIFVFPDLTKDIINSIAKDYDIKSMDPKIALAISIGISTLLYFIYSWLIRRVATGKSRGTLLLVLLLFSIIGGLASLFYNFTIINSILLAVDLYAFYEVCQARK